MVTSWVGEEVAVDVTRVREIVLNGVRFLVAGSPNQLLARAGTRFVLYAEDGSVWVLDLTTGRYAGVQFGEAVTKEQIEGVELNQVDDGLTWVVDGGTPGQSQ